MKNNITFRDILRSQNKGKLLISAVIAVFFAAVIVIYNLLLLNSINENMISTGQISAERSAKTVDTFLSDCSKSLAIVEYTLNDLIVSGAPDEEMLDFVIKQDASLENIISAGTTKLYAYIGGMIFDGKQGVIRKPDYVAAERPWYRKASADKGNFVLVDPYKDIHTGNILMTIAKMMSDGSSFVMFDVSLEHIQSMIEQQSASSSSLTEMVLSGTCTVVAHSDIGELNKSYLSEEGSIGHAVVANISGSEEQHFNVSFGGHRYTAYIVPIHGGWLSISAVATSDEYMPIRIMFMVSVIVSAALFAAVVWMLIRTGRKEMLADRLTSQLSSAADIYLSLSDIDLVNNSLIQIKNFDPRFMTQFTLDENDVQETFNRIMESMPDTPTKQAAIDFVDLSTLEDRLAQKGSIILEYQSHGYKWVRARFVVSERDQNGRLTHVLWMLEDIDSEKKDREKLIDMSERAVAANEAKSSFLSNMSHEIRTPINAVLGMNEMVLRESSDPAAVVSYSESIRTAGNTLLGLINDILDFSKIEAGKMEIIPVDYDLATVLSDLVNMIQTRLDNKGLMLITDFDSTMPHLLHGDEVRIKQIITNILTNAAKYTEQGSVTFSVTYERIDGEPDSILLKVSVKDTGIGIKPEDMSKLFSKFERIEEERNRTVEGTGLGMSITQSLLAMMDSKLDVSSVYGEGSVFGFSLKQRVRRWDELGDYAQAHKNSLTSRKKYHEKFTAPDAHILVVDDTVMNLLVFTSLLKSTLVKIDTAENGDDGIMLALKNKYDIIFLDHMMPQKDGIETLHEMRASDSGLNRDTPTICLTANAISGAREKYLEAGFDDYLTKPIESAKLEDMICEYLPPEKLKKPSDVKPKRRPKVAVPDAVFGIIELDAVAGINNAGSEEMYMELLRAYSGMMNSHLDRLTDYWLGGDTANAAVILHSIKGASRTVGAEQIRRRARELENAAFSGDADTLNRGMEDFMFRCRALGARIASVAGNDTAAADKCGGDNEA